MFPALPSYWVVASYFLDWGEGILTSWAVGTPHEKNHTCMQSGTRSFWKTILLAHPSVCLQLINYLMERLGWGRCREILTENQSEMKINSLQNVPVGQ